MIKAIIFDCFGVLVGRGFDETYRYAGGNPENDKQFIGSILRKANLGLMTQKEFIQAITKKLGISMDDYSKAEQEAEQPNYELLDYILELRTSLKTAILSNANLGVLERRIGTELLEKCFDARIISAEVSKIKPDPEIYTITTKKLGVKPEECVFVDDKIVYCEAARAVGMQAILYEDFPQLKEDLEKALATSTNN